MFNLMLAIIVGASVSPLAAGELDTAIPVAPDAVADPGAIIVAGNARFTLLGPSVVRLEWSPDGRFEDRPSQVVVNRRLPVPSFKKIEGGGLLTATAPAMQKSLDPRVLVIRCDRVEVRYRRDGKPFSKDNLVVALRVGAEGAEVWWEASPPFAQCTNLGGTVRTLDDVSGACPLPAGLLNRYGWTFLDDSKTLLLDNDGWLSSPPGHEPGSLDWYLFAYGSDYKMALADFVSIAGRIPLPPRFVFGAWWSRYWPYSDTELRELVGEFRRHDVPLDVLVVDMDWHLDGWTGYTWNPTYFPKPEEFLDWAHGEGLRVALNLHPAEGVGSKEKAFDEMCKALDLDPRATDRIPFDCTDRRFVDAYFKYLHHPLEASGVDFWWLDWQQGTKTAVFGLDPLWWLNHLHWSDMERRSAATGKRPLIFSRWGGLGNHRYPIGFSGDTYSDWPSFAFQPFFTSTAGNVGYGYWSHDVGGHFHGPVKPELYARWIQWGALSPVLRTHATRHPGAERRIWTFPAEVFDAARKAFHLRYELLPYVYSMARKCFDTGLPLCRPLYYEWPDVEESYHRGGEYLFGDDLLVAPVTEPADPIGGCAMVEVWLPPGKWTHWFTGATYEGPREIHLPVPLDETPLFVRDGAIIPSMSRTQRGGEAPVDPLILNVFPGDVGRARVYEEDGVSDGYRQGRCAWTPVSHEAIEGGRRVVIGPVEGAYPGMIGERRYLIRLYDVPPSLPKITHNGKTLRFLSSAPPKTWEPCGWYEPSHMGYSIQLPPCPLGEKQTIEITDATGREMSREVMNGFRGMMSTLCWATNQTQAAMFGAAGDCDPSEYIDAIARDSQSGAPKELPERWADLTNVFCRLQVPEAVRTRVLLRQLGLYYKLTVDRRPDGGDALQARARIGTTNRTGNLRDCEVGVELHSDGPLKVVSSISGSQVAAVTSRARGLEEGRLLGVEAELRRGDEDLDTCVVRADVSIQLPNKLLAFSMEKVLWPSINAWWIVGPFDNPSPGDLGSAKPPEARLELDADYEGRDGRRIRWREVRRGPEAGSSPLGENYVDLAALFGGKVRDAVAYAMTNLVAPEEMDVVLALGSDDGAAVWLNGREVHRSAAARVYASREDRIPVRLKKGPNELLVKIGQTIGGWAFCAHVETSDGRPVPQVVARLKP